MRVINRRAALESHRNREPVERNDWGQPLNILQDVNFMDFPWGQFAAEIGLIPGEPPLRNDDFLTFSWILQIYGQFLTALHNEPTAYYNLDRWYKDNFDDLVSMTLQIKKSNNRSLYPFLQRLLVANRLAGIIPDKPSRDEIAAQ